MIYKPEYDLEKYFDEMNANDAMGFLMSQQGRRGELLELPEDIIREIADFKSEPLEWWENHRYMKYRHVERGLFSVQQRFRFNREDQEESLHMEHGEKMKLMNIQFLEIYKIIEARLYYHSDEYYNSQEYQDDLREDYEDRMRDAYKDARGDRD
jgi:hypothetical protein